MSIPGIPGQSAPPSPGDLQRQLRGMQQEIEALRTAQTLMATQTSAFVTSSYNGSTDFIPVDPSGSYMHSAWITIPEGYTRAIVYLTVSVGGTNSDTNPQYIYCYPVIEAPGEDVTDPNGLVSTGDAIARAVPALFGDSVTSTFCRTMEGLPPGDEIYLSVVGYCDAPSHYGNTGNGHLSALIVFFR